MDELSAYNKERWEALVRANVEWSRAFLDRFELAVVHPLQM